MPLVQGKCENCGGILSVDSDLKTANCPYCGMTYIVQDSITKYNTTINIENLHANIVNMFDEKSSEGRIKAADAYLKMEEFEKAFFEYKHVTEIAPQNHLAWVGLIASYTNNYSKRIRSKIALQTLEKYSKSVQALVPQDTSEELLRDYYSYKNAEEEKNSVEINSIVQAKNDQTNELKLLKKKRINIQNSIEQAKSICDYQPQQTSAEEIGYIVLVFFFGIVLSFIGIFTVQFTISYPVTPDIKASLIFFELGILCGGVIAIIKGAKRIKAYIEHKNESKIINGKLVSLKKDLKLTSEKVKNLKDSIEHLQEKLSAFD